MSRDKRFFVICLIAAAVIVLGAISLHLAMGGDRRLLAEKSPGISKTALFSTPLSSHSDQITPTVTLIPVPEGGMEYTVGNGDTLSDIALRFGVSMEELAGINRILSTELIREGMRLVIPKQAILVPNPTSTQTLHAKALTYTVQSGDTPWNIALKFGVPVDALMSMNGITNPTTLQVGQELVIPSKDGSNIIAPAGIAAYSFSKMDGNVDAGYPLVAQGAGFRAHYQPGSLAEREINYVTQFVPVALAHINTTLGVSFAQTVDVYLADTLFAPPNQALGGKADSANRRLFVQYNSRGRAWRRYLLAHELTHVVAWNTYGPPASAMLSEGLAVYASERFLLEEPNTPIWQMCQAWQAKKSLPGVDAPALSYSGHVSSFEAYLASGCFVGYVMKNFDTDAIKKNYTQPVMIVQGKNIAQLAKEFLMELAGSGNLPARPSMNMPDMYDVLRIQYEKLWKAAGSDRQIDKNELAKLDEQWQMMLQAR